VKIRVPNRGLWQAVLGISLVLCTAPLRASAESAGLTLGVPSGDLAVQTADLALAASPAAAYSVAAGGDDIVISEIMYHPGHSATSPEDLRLEWIELFNRGTLTVNLAGWRLSDGVEFVFPAVSLGAGKYLVVAANASVFKARYPGVTNVVGGWTGRLSNSGEKIELADASGEVVNAVEYADEGEWTVRELGPVDGGHRGWQWSDAHDGGGRSLELIDAMMPNEYGQNWAASLVDGGTPGAPRGVQANDIAPLILDVGHRPLIPGPTDAVTVTARILDEQATGLAVTLRYRLDSSTYTDQNTYPHFDSASYRSVSMFDDGAHGDKRAGDGVFGAQIPAQPNGRVVEFYVEARDGRGNVRTWPAPSLVDGVPQQVTNALYQVDGSFDPTWVPGSFPVYYIIMTEMERGRLEYIGRHSTLSGPNSQMNATFISLDGTGMAARYRVGVRNRGHGTRNGPPNNYHVAFASDRPWHGRFAVNFNCRNPPGQIMGSALFRMAGLAAPRAMPARVRINGANLATANMYGVYVRLDAFDGTYAEQDFCGDPDGNLYSCFRDNGEADLRYLGSDPGAYRRSYFKESNASADDWSDLIRLVDVLNNANAATYLQNVGEVINVSYWLRYIALDSLLMNNETGLNLGIGDDYFMYRGVSDPRFVLIPHDLDTILDQGGDVGRSILAIANGSGNYNGVDGLKRFFSYPDVIIQYRQAMLDLMDDFFNPETLDPLFDRVLGGFAPTSRIDAMKQRVRQRMAAVLAEMESQPLVNRPPRPGDGLAPPETPTTVVPSRPLVINEVLAVNASALQHDNAYPGAVELYCGGPTAVNLAGMSLSDDPGQPRKFIFPAGATMNAGQYLLLYADYGGTASEPHLGFGLDGSGGGVYLFDKAGVPVDAVEFGTQLADLSIGRLGPLGEWGLAVPTLGAANVAYPQGDPHVVRINEWLASGDVLVPSDFIELYNSNPDPVDLGGMSLSDSPFLSGCRYRIRPLSFLAGQGYAVFWADNSREPGHVDWRLSVEGGLIGLFDNQDQEVDKIIFGDQTTDFSEGRTPDGVASLAILPLPTPGLANPHLQITNATTVPLVPERADKRVLVPTGAISEDWKGGRGFNDTDWQLCTGAPGGVGFERSQGYETLIRLDTGAQMYGTGGNNSCYIRIAFTVEPRVLADLRGLTLAVRYDDGFVAYLNGTEIARRNFTGEPRWNSAASTTNSDNNAVNLEPFDVTAQIGKLRPGQNVLALQGMNNSLTSSDFLISATLDGVLEPAADGTGYGEELKLLDGLRITELMYQAPQGSDGDYVELQNVISEPLELGGVRFDKGIDFVFPASTLRPGQCVVVAANTAAFRAAYGAAPAVAGQYQGNLSNGGEKLVLLLPVPVDVAILRFDYNDARSAATDGGGQSLTIRNPTGPPAAWDDPESWQAADPTPGRP
jgi:hypothetical protein